MYWVVVGGYQLASGVQPDDKVVRADDSRRGDHDRSEMMGRVGAEVVDVHCPDRLVAPGWGLAGSVVRTESNLHVDVVQCEAIGGDMHAGREAFAGHRHQAGEAQHRNDRPARPGHLRPRRRLGRPVPVVPLVAVSSRRTHRCAPVGGTFRPSSGLIAAGNAGIGGRIDRRWPTSAPLPGMRRGSRGSPRTRVRGSTASSFTVSRRPLASAPGRLRHCGAR